MKKRFGFVSNSSSSSFMCDLTYATEGGYDASAVDCGMAECVNGHTVVEGLLLPEPSFDLNKLVDEFVEYHSRFSYRDQVTKEDLREAMKEVSDYSEFIERIQSDFDEEYGDYLYPAHRCPICMMKDLPAHQMFEYLLKKLDKDRQTVVSEIQFEFNGNIKDFEKFVSK
jgi:hypothetical protein